jgi:hypothetical protein
MVCPRCGASFDGIGSFCPHCGAQVVPAAMGGTQPSPAGYGPGYPGYPPGYTAAPGYGYGAPASGYAVPPYVPPIQPRVSRSLQLLTILWGCFAVYRLASGLAGIFFLHMMSHRGMFGYSFPFNSMGAPWMSALLPFNLVSTLAMVGLTALVAYGMLHRRPWGRTLAIVMSILSLLKFPFGTALGIYTLWVFAPAASAMEYESIADRTRPGF